VADLARAAQVLAALDPQQAAAVLAPPGPVRILAGAGTGKTRTIVHRIAYQSLTGVCDPRTVLAVTHSARAAAEMRDRVAALGVPGCADPHVSCGRTGAAVLLLVGYRPAWSRPPACLGCARRPVRNAARRAGARAEGDPHPGGVHRRDGPGL